MTMMVEGKASGDEPTHDIEFALEHFDVVGRRWIVQGRWFGIVGRRFVRPVLQVDGRRRVALLDHKPWAAEEGALWLASFEHEGDPAPARLQVAPDIVVQLPRPGPKAGDGRRRPARVRRSHSEGRFEHVVPERDNAARQEPIATADASEPARERLERVRDERDAARAEAHDLRNERDLLAGRVEELKRRLEGLGEMRRERDDAVRLAGQLRAEVNALRADRTRAVADAERVREQLQGMHSQGARLPTAVPNTFGTSAPRRADWASRLAAMGSVVALGFAVFYLIGIL